MMLQPNKTILEGRFTEIVPRSDGFGADLEFFVIKSQAARGFDDFLRAPANSTIRLFSADTRGLRTGTAYRLTVTVLGGPQGERAVIESAQALGR